MNFEILFFIFSNFFKFSKKLKFLFKTFIYFYFKMNKTDSKLKRASLKNISHTSNPNMTSPSPLLNEIASSPMPLLQQAHTENVNKINSQVLKLLIKNYKILCNNPGNLRLKS
jgi:hypothetical protein